MIGIDRFMPDTERATPRRLVGLALGFAGIVVLVWPEIRLGDTNGFMGGLVATQLACLGWAIGSNYARRRGRQENVIGAAAIEMVAAGIGLMIPGLILGEVAALHFSERSLAAFAYLGVFGSVIGFSAYGYALKYLPLSTVSLYAYINPVIAVTLGVTLLGEPFDARMATAAALVFMGVAVVRWKSSRPPTQSAPVAPLPAGDRKRVA
jgi:drug/metabolite transporter (DMT)-like permease